MIRTLNHFIQDRMPAAARLHTRACALTWGRRLPKKV
jgi:hypothetical protein